MKFYRGLFILFLGGCCSALISCGPEHIEGKTKGDSPGAASVSLEKLLEKPEDIIFADIQSFVLNDNCIVCHKPGNTTANVDLSSYEAAFGEGATVSTIKAFSPEQSSIYETLIVPSGSRHMPPLDKPQLNKDQINLVYQWVVNGAKKEKSQKVERPQSLQEELQPFFDQPQTVDYVAVNKYVFDNSCNKCHSWNGATPNHDDAISFGHDMTTYESVLANKGIVFDKRGNPRLEDFLEKNDQGVKKLIKGSRMYKSAAIKQTMPPERDGYKPVDSLRLKLLRLWIINCVIEDYSKVDPETDNLKDRVKNGKIRNCPKPESEN